MAMLPDDMKHLINFDEKVHWVLKGSETIVVSNQRIIIGKTAGLGLKKTYVDYPYSNMVNIRLDRGIRKASIEIQMRAGVPTVKIGNLSKNDAYELHRVLRDNIIAASASHPGQPFPVVIQPNSISSGGRGDGEQMCKKCGRKVSADFALCPFCSTPLKIECPECGKKLDRAYKVCPYCAEDLSYLEEIDLEL